MKLITEICEDYRTFLEEDSKGKKRMYIEGIFLQGDAANRNRRIYPVDMLAEKVGAYSTNFVDRNRAYGELGHPQGPTINGDRICMRIVELKRDGNNFTGKAQISSTPMGKIVEGLINDGGLLGVSSRGMGTLKPRRDGINEVQNDYMIAAVDVVTDPSAQEAFVNGVMENVEWVQVNGSWVPEYLDNMKKTINKVSKSQLQEAKIKAFERFVRNL